MLSERQQNHLFKRLGSSRLNNSCADCYVKGATWTSVDFGVFICINCSGCHRSFGMHITRVRSTKLDSWSREDAKIMELVGNEVANSFYLGNKNEKFLKGTALSFGNSRNRRDHIKKKYLEKAFARTDIEAPVNFVKENNYSLTKSNIREMYLGETQKPTQTIKKTNQVTKNKKRPINLKGLNKNQKKKPVKQDLNSNNNLLDFDLDITPANKAPKDLWDMSSKNIITTPAPQKTITSDENLLDFNFGPVPQTINKGSTDLFGFDKPSSNNFPKPPSKNNQMFNNNSTFTNKISNDKYNCLSFNPQPQVNNNNNFFYSNQPPSSNQNMYSNGMANGMANGSHKNIYGNGWNSGINKKPDNNKIQDKYDVFDLCLNNNNRNGYFN